MRNFISNFMFMINGPGPIEEKSQNLNAAISTIAQVTNCGMFAGDCLITWAKSMGFLEDAKFLNAVNAQITPDPFIENSVKGTIWRSHVRCWAAQQCLGVDGDYVEAACHLGISSRMMADYVDFGQVDKTYWLYDTLRFCGRRNSSGMAAAVIKSPWDRIAMRSTALRNSRALPGHFQSSKAAQTSASKLF